MTQLKKCKKIVLDIETTGLPNKVRIDYKNCKNENKYKLKFIHPAFFEKYDNCRIIEIAYVLLDEDDQIIKSCSSLIKGNSIKNSDIHGITEQMCQEQGVLMMDFFNEFETDLKSVQVFVAHNAEFDFTVLLSECYRYNRSDIIYMLKKIKIYCTMHNGSRVLKSTKFLKLIELYKHYFKDDETQTHRALDDVIMCYKSYLKIKDNLPVFIFMDYVETVETVETEKN